MTELPRVLLIEDEPAIADTLLYALKTEGFAPEWCATGRAGVAALTAKNFSFVVLDVGLPDGSGFEVCKEIRATSRVPILFLTARSAEVDRIVGLEIGGDDYMTKPFSPRELTARVKAILRRTAPTAPTSAGSEAGPTGKPVCHPLDDKLKNPRGETESGCHLMDDKLSGGGAGRGRWFEVDGERCEIRFRGVALELTRYEYRLLRVLVGRPGRVFSRDELMTAVWEDPGASLDRTVDAHVKSLRAKLRATSAKAAADSCGVGRKREAELEDDDPIRTHRGMGYSLRERSVE